MALRIVKTWVPSAEEWDNTWCNCPYSTFFHSREWAEIWSVYSHEKITSAPLGVEFSDGTRIILPFSKEQVSKGLINRYISSPAGTFGGWISDVSLNDSQQKLLIELIVKQYPDLLWRFNPYEKVRHTKEFRRLTEDETHVLDLNCGFEEIYRGWANGQASTVRKARKARKAGVEIIIARDLEDWKDYYRVYEDSLNRWGDKKTSSYNWSFFETTFRIESPNIKLWLAKYNDLVIAGALCFYSPTHAVYWHGAALSNYFELRPVNLLMFEAIRDAAEHGYKWFDFNPSGGHEGVKAFKRSFGANSLSCDIITTVSMRTRVLSMLSQLKNQRLK